MKFINKTLKTINVKINKEFQTLKQNDSIDLPEHIGKRLGLEKFFEKKKVEVKKVVVKKEVKKKNKNK